MKVMGLVEGTGERMFQAEGSTCCENHRCLKMARMEMGLEVAGEDLSVGSEVRSLLRSIVRKECDLSWKHLSSWNFSPLS